MFKINMITRFLAVLLVLGFFAFTVVPCRAGDAKLENLLKNPGVAEQMQAIYGGEKSLDNEQETPLVKQAKAFALRINPPPPPEPVRSAPSPAAVIRPQATVTAKFKLIGTSYHLGDDADSWALIDEVGKGLHWVQQGGKVGYLTIEKVGDGSVLINDNGKRYELTAERQTKPDFVKSYTGIVSNDKPIALWEGMEKVTGQAESVEPPPANISQPVAEPNVAPVPELSPEELRQHTQKNIEWLKQLQQDPNSNITSGEANELGGLGELLKTLENELKQQEEILASDNNALQVPDVNLVSNNLNNPQVDNNSPKSSGDANQQSKPRQEKPQQQQPDSKKQPVQLRGIRQRR
ncbi:MAG: hypothetical protein WC496_08715 [Phycisphaerae bacterium]|jgi:hypothetical protein